MTEQKHAIAAAGVLPGRGGPALWPVVPRTFWLFSGQTALPGPRHGLLFAGVSPCSLQFTVTVTALGTHRYAWACMLADPVMRDDWWLSTLVAVLSLFLLSFFSLLSCAAQRVWAAVCDAGVR